MIGERFGRLVVMASAVSEKGRSRLLCLCDCGTKKTVAMKDLKSGNTKSCGCLRYELSSKRILARCLRHGHATDAGETPTYRTWHSMINRCTNKNSSIYSRYGAQGISVCERWMRFENFLADMGERPDGHSIDRYPDNEGNYGPGNCRWATPKQQTANRKCSHKLQAEGKTQTIGEWATEKGLPYIQLHRRLSKGWPVDRALNKPLEVRKPRQQGVKA